MSIYPHKIKGVCSGRYRIEVVRKGVRTVKYADTREKAEEIDRALKTEVSLTDNDDQPSNLGNCSPQNDWFTFLLGVSEATLTTVAQTKPLAELNPGSLECREGKVVTPGRFPELSHDEMKSLHKLRKIIKRFRGLEARMPTSYVDAFISVALKPGLGPTEYAKDLGTLQPMASRILLEIGNYSREREKGLGLVDRQLSASSLARQEYFLTPKGKNLIRDVVAIMKS